MTVWLWIRDWLMSLEGVVEGTRYTWLWLFVKTVEALILSTGVRCCWLICTGPPMTIRQGLYRTNSWHWPLGWTHSFVAATICCRHVETQESCGRRTSGHRQQIPVRTGVYKINARHLLTVVLNPDFVIASTRCWYIGFQDSCGRRTSRNGQQISTWVVAPDTMAARRLKPPVCLASMKRCCRVDSRRCCHEEIPREGTLAAIEVVLKTTNAWHWLPVFISQLSTGVKQPGLLPFLPTRKPPKASSLSRPSLPLESTLVEIRSHDSPNSLDGNIQPIEDSTRA